jgi:hypothetical protein
MRCKVVSLNRASLQGLKFIAMQNSGVSGLGASDEWDRYDKWEEWNPWNNAIEG